ncbi:SEC10/PgrA surface exclusion domain-containing protein [Gemelliphila palaticanis]|uniref:SEC10/PgrA surface exclusion domain-containing protein n=1 Tax=Gemelliphila palaticanis TaxID=81950 RepID=A0ABX2SZ52_9BACL|nr:SEC10/PgrA surface exclusion domain-containing protein [Gemella palaticanis]MBF0715715.1 SEC10/PgrA surface exclusion domain-containing protein [Gemella palaticanis]NYS47645.1 SEC10/PgrA surface exclusion domain-containing protein [Gemella palaticanis]
MKKYALRKIGKKLLPVAFGIAVLSIAGLTGEVSAKENLTVVRAVGMEEKATKEQLEIAKSNLDNTISEVKYQEESFSKIKKEVESTKELVNLKTNEIKELEEISKKSTVENISEAKNNILAEENNVKVVEESLSNQENLVTSSKEEVSNQTRVIEEKQKEVATAEKEVSKSEQDYNTSKATLEGTNAENVTKALSEAKATDETAREELEKARLELEEAKKVDLERTENIKKVTSEKNTITTEVSTAKTNLTNTENKAQETTTALNKATTELERVKNDVNSFNTVTLTKDYIDNLKKAVDFNISKEERDLAKKKLKEVNKELLSLNKYKANANDDNVVKYDINNLPEDIRKGLSLFASELVNQIRTQVGTKKTSVTTSSMDFADKVAGNYTRDKFNPYVESGHHETGIIEVAQKYGLPEGQFYENWAGNTRIKSSLTYSQLKEYVYNSILQFMFNGREWLHAQSVAGINYGNPKNQYIGVDFATYTEHAGVHLFTISKEDVENATKNNFDKKEIESTVTLEKLKEELKQAAIDYNKKLLEDKIAQQNLANAKSVYEAKSTELAAISEKLNILLSQKELVPEAEAKVKTLTIALEKANQDLVKAQENYDNLSADIKTKKKAVDNAKKVLDEKLANLQTARSILNIEKSKLSKLNNKLKEQEDNISSIKKELEQAQTKVKKAKEYLYKLENTPKLLTVAKEQLARLEQELTNKEELLKSELSNLDKVKEFKQKLENRYLELFEKYNKQIELDNVNLQELTEGKEKLNSDISNNKEKQESKNFTTLTEDNQLKLEKVKEHSNKNNYKVLPNTGDNTSSAVGVGILGLLATFLFGRKRNN